MRIDPKKPEGSAEGTDNSKGWGEGQPLELTQYGWQITGINSYIYNWYFCPNCKGGFSTWEREPLNADKEKCPFCNMEKGKYKAKEE